MGQFLKKPPFDLGHPGEFITLGPTVYLSDVYGEILVPTGFTTDFASIPSVVPRWILDPAEDGRWPAVIHDYLAREAKTRKERYMADKVFLEAMTDQGLPAYKRYPMFIAVLILSTFKRYES